MNKHLKNFLMRGMAFGGFGPIIAGIVYFILSFTVSGFSLDGAQVFVAIVSTYILAFVQAGSSVFHQIESLPLAKSLLLHLSTLYVAYVGCYLVNSWIPFDWLVIIIFTAIFVVTYLIIWLIVYFIIKRAQKDLNAKLGV